jgi:hypothetical protein
MKLMLFATVRKIKTLIIGITVRKKPILLYEEIINSLLALHRKQVAVSRLAYYLFSTASYESYV